MPPLQTFWQEMSPSVVYSKASSFTTSTHILLDWRFASKKRRQGDRGQKYEVEKSVKIRPVVRDDAPSPLDGGLAVEARRRWPSISRIEE